MALVASAKYDRHLPVDQVIDHLILLLGRHLLDLIEGPLKVILITAKSVLSTAMVLSVATSSAVFTVLAVVLLAEFALFFELAAEALKLFHELLVEEQLPDAERRCQHDENNRLFERAAHEPPAVVGLLAGSFEANDRSDCDEEPHQEAYKGSASHELAKTALLQDFLVDLVLASFLATMLEMSTLLLESV